MRLISVFVALFASAPAFAAQIDRVPEDFPTIQDAVDNGTSPEIEVGPGQWAGARITRRVVLQGDDGAQITSGPDVDGHRIGFVVGGKASGTRISGFTFACGQSATLDGGVYSSARRGVPAHEVTISDNTFAGCVQGVTIAGHPTNQCQPESVDGGADWTVEDNTFDGFRSVDDRGELVGGLGIVLFNAEGASVIGNHFTGHVQDSAKITTSGVLVAGCWDCTVADNKFATYGANGYWAAISNFGAYQHGAAATQRLTVDNNDAKHDPGPQLDVNFRSYDSFDTSWTQNSGVTFIDHTDCGDGELDTYTTK